MLKPNEVLVDFGSYEAGVDKEVVELVIQMNRFEGIRTMDSCCGHGEHGVWIFFLADSLESLPSLLFYVDSCHNGCPGWQVIARTDCSMAPTSFLLESTNVGQTAYDEAEKIAGYMRDYLDDPSESEGE